MSSHHENHHHDPHDPEHQHGGTHPHGPGQEGGAKGHGQGHAHEHSHPHGHGHEHTHEEEHECDAVSEPGGAGTVGAPPSGGLTDRQKLIKMLQHWVAHSEEHAKSYSTWADRCRAMGEDQAARTLDKITDSSRIQTENFRLVLAMLGEPLM